MCQTLNLRKFLFSLPSDSQSNHLTFKNLLEWRNYSWIISYTIRKKISNNQKQTRNNFRRFWRHRFSTNSQVVHTTQSLQGSMTSEGWIMRFLLTCFLLAFFCWLLAMSSVVIIESCVSWAKGLWSEVVHVGKHLSASPLNQKSIQAQNHHSRVRFEFQTNQIAFRAFSWLGSWSYKLTSILQSWKQVLKHGHTSVDSSTSVLEAFVCSLWVEKFVITFQGNHLVLKGENPFQFNVSLKL